MSTAIRFSKFEFPDAELKSSGLDLSENEVKVSFFSKDPVLPVSYRGRNILVKWGNKGSARVPRTGYCKTDSLKGGKWQWLKPEPMMILACFALTNGVWFHVRQGIEGVIVKGENSVLYGYMLTKPSTHYFKIMTGAERMPVLAGQIL